MILKQQYKRFRTHAHIVSVHIRSKLFPEPDQELFHAFDDLENDEQLCQWAEEFDRECEEYVRSEPVLNATKTILFSNGGRHMLLCNFLTARYYRTLIRKTYFWAVANGFDTFIVIVDESTPVGLLALEVLLDLRSVGESFRLYAVRTKSIVQRKSYRLIPETNLELCMMNARCDYRYDRMSIYFMKHKICPKPTAWTSKKSIHIAGRDINQVISEISALQ